MNPRQVHIVDNIDGALCLNRLLDDGSNVLRFAEGAGLAYKDGCKRFGWTIREGWADGGFHGFGPRARCREGVPLMATVAPRVYVASDYAGCEAGDWRFYYGYQSTEREPDEDGDGGEWCFEATLKGEVVVKAPWSKLGADDRWNCEQALLAGIGWMVARGYLVAATPPRTT